MKDYDPVLRAYGGAYNWKLEYLEDDRHNILYGNLKVAKMHPIFQYETWEEVSFRMICKK